MPLTYDITVGIGAGFVSVGAAIKVVRARPREVHPLMWIVRSRSSSSSSQDWILASCRQPTPAHAARRPPHPAVTALRPATAGRSIALPG